MKLQTKHCHFFTRITSSPSICLAIAQFKLLRCQPYQKLFWRGGDKVSILGLAAKLPHSGLLRVQILLQTDNNFSSFLGFYSFAAGKQITGDSTLEWHYHSRSLEIGVPPFGN